MNEQPINTISVTVYTPSGTRAYINFGTLITAAELDSKVAELGYLVNAPGQDAGQEPETVTHVIRATQYNKSDGTTTPIIGLFFANPKLLFARKAYLDRAEDIATFERLSGLKVDKLPEFPSATLPKRDEKSAARFIIAAKTPFQVVMEQDTYTDESGETKSGKKFAGFYEGSKPQAAPPVSPSTSGQQTDSGKSGEKWTDDVQQMEWLKNTVALMRDVYGDTHVDTAKVTVKATDFQTAMEYADALEVQAEVAKADWFKAAIMLASKFLYTEGTEYNAFKHNASIDKRLQDKGDLGINPSQTLLEALNRLIRYRALADLYLDSTDYPKIFGIPFEAYVDKHGHLATWQRMNQYFAAQLEPAKTKIAS